MIFAAILFMKYILANVFIVVVSHNEYLLFYNLIIFKFKVEQTDTLMRHNVIS